MIMSQIVGHRGSAGYVLENTLDSIRHAAKLGASWIEADATLLKDGTVVLFHDDELKRCMGVDGLVRDLNEARATEIGIPLFKDALTLCKELGLGFNVELKTHDTEAKELAQAAYDVIRTIDCGPLTISSFDFDALYAYEGDHYLSLLYDDLEADWKTHADALKVQSVNLWAEPLKPEHVAAVKETGREVYVFTVNKADRARELYDWGVDGVFTDYPNLFAT